MRIFLTGATGYVGTGIIEQILNHSNDELFCLVRQPDRLPVHPRLRPIVGDIGSPDTYTEALAACEAVIHLIGIIREIPRRGVTFERIHVQGTHALLHACAKTDKTSSRRFILMSALGARPQASTAYFQTKWQAEQLVQASGLPYVIFRPSVIIGKGSAMLEQLAGLIRLPLTPVIGDGQYRLQPVALTNVARLFHKSVRGEPIRQVWDVGGPHPITYDALLHTLAKTMGRSVRLLHLPLSIMKPLIARCESLPGFPITTTQLTMLLEESICRSGNDAYAAYDETALDLTASLQEWQGTIPTLQP